MLSAMHGLVTGEGRSPSPSNVVEVHRQVTDNCGITDANALSGVRSP